MSSAIKLPYSWSCSRVFTFHENVESVDKVILFGRIEQVTTDTLEDVYIQAS